MRYFTLSELTSSNTAKRKGIKNYPNSSQAAALITLTERVLDPARESLGLPIRVSSGFRCDELNRAVGGAPNSQHTKGQAVDLQCYDNARLFNIIRDHGIFDQLIWEYGDAVQPQWVHVSYNHAGGQRREVLRAVKQNGKTKYLPYLTL